MARERVGPVIDAERGEQFVCAAPGVAVRDTVRVNRGQTNILNRGEMLEEAMELKDHTDLAAQPHQRRLLGGAVSGQLNAVDRDFAGIE